MRARFPRYSVVERTRILASLGISAAAEGSRALIADLERRLHAFSQPDESAGLRGEERRQLTALAEAIEDVQRAYADLSPSAELRIQALLYWCSPNQLRNSELFDWATTNDDAADIPELRAAIAMLWRPWLSIQEELQTLPATGRVKQTRLVRAIEELCMPFRKATNSEPGRRYDPYVGGTESRFEHFVRACLVPLKLVEEETSLDWSIRRALINEPRKRTTRARLAIDTLRTMALFVDAPTASDRQRGKQAWNWLIGMLEDDFDAEPLPAGIVPAWRFYALEKILRTTAGSDIRRAAADLRRTKIGLLSTIPSKRTWARRALQQITTAIGMWAHRKLTDRQKAVRRGGATWQPSWPRLPKFPA